MKKRYTAMIAAVLAAGVLTGCGMGSQKDIGQDQAKSIAFEDVGVSESEVSRLRVEKDRDDGILQYDIQFDVDGKEYSYEINGSDGDILSSEVETITDNTAPASGTAGQGTAASGQGAAADTQNNGNSAADTTNAADNGSAAENSQTGTAGTDNAAAGNAAVSEGQTGQSQGEANVAVSAGQGQGTANVAVSADQARAAALERVPGATEADIRMELDFDDGYYIYEGDIIYQQVEYEFEIDAQSGNFLKWSEERY